jgi:hypothetical protein
MKFTGLRPVAHEIHLRWAPAKSANGLSLKGGP